MRIVVTGILFIVYMLFRCPAWLASTDTPYLLRAMSYSLFHTGFIHFLINTLSICVLFSGRDERREGKEMALSLLVAFLVYPLGTRPCVGFSNALFATCGMRSRPLSCTYWWRQPQIIFFLVIMLTMCFMPQFAGTNHLAAYILGFLCMNIETSLQPLIRDASRYTGNRANH